MVELAAVFMDRIAIIGRIHKFVGEPRVDMNHALRGHGHQRNCDLRIVHARAGQNRADRHLSAGHIEMQFVTTPVLLVSVAARLRTDITMPAVNPSACGPASGDAVSECVYPFHWLWPGEKVLLASG